MIKPLRQIDSQTYPSFNALNQLVVLLFPNRTVSQSSCQRRYYDTFDWRLYKAGYLLEEDVVNKKRTLRLRTMTGDAFMMEQPVTKAPRFYRDLPAGRLKDRLLALINERALMPMGLIYVSRVNYEITNSDEKIILRMAVEGLFSNKQRHDKKAVANYLELYPLRGYEKEMQKILRRLSKECGFTDCLDKPALPLFKVFGRTPGDYTSKLDIELEPDMPSHTALSSALIYNLDIMEKNETGIINDIDIEFLHDFRIAGRRSRSVLGQVRDVFPHTRLNRFTDNLSWLSKLTSPHRDLDVFLWDFNDYVKQVSHNGGEELEPLRRLLQQRRQREHRRLLSAFHTKRFEQFKNDWRSFLEEEQKKSLNIVNADTQIIDVANRSIRRNFKKMLRQGNVIKANYTYESIHTLRKNGKKLRYLIDTFKSLYPRHDVETVKRCLRRLQNNLGEITDMHVQRDMLHNWKTTLAADNKIPVHTMAAINELEHQCALKEKHAEKKFKHRYREFSSKSNRQLIQHMFK